MKNKNTKKLERELELKALELEKKLAIKALAKKESELQELDSAKNNDNISSNNLVVDEVSKNDFDVEVEENETYENDEFDEQNIIDITKTNNHKDKNKNFSRDTTRPRFFDETKNKDFDDNQSSQIEMEDLVDYCDFIEDTAKKLNTHIARKAGSWGEKRAARTLREHSQSALQNPSRLEPFNSRFLRGRGSVVVLGIFYLVCLVLYLVSFGVKAQGGQAMTIVVFLLFVFGTAIIITLMLGLPWFKALYPKQISYNVVSVIEPKEKVEKTIVVSCNYDSPLGNNYNPKANFMPYVMLSAFATLVIFMIFCIIKMSSIPDTAGKIAALIVIPVIFSACAIAAFLSYISLSKNKVQENNGIGVATALATVKYILELEKIPDNCRIVFVAFAAENAGHGGAENFVALHKNEKDFLINPIAINIGNVFDENITVIEKDIIRFEEYDKEFVDLAVKAANEQNINIDKYNKVGNSIYGFASTPFSKKAIPAVTILSKDMTVNPLKAETIENVNRNVIENYFKVSVAIVEKLLGE